MALIEQYLNNELNDVDRAAARERLMAHADGDVVGRTAKSFKLELEIEECEVAAVLVRQTDWCEEAFRQFHHSEKWELLVPRIAGRVLTRSTKPEAT